MPLDFSSFGTPVGPVQGEGMPGLVADLQADLKSGTLSPDESAATQKNLDALGVASAQKPDFSAFGTPVTSPTPQKTLDITPIGGDDLWGTIQAGADAPAPISADGKRDVGVGESAFRGWGQAGAESGKLMMLAPAAFGVVADAIKNSFTGGSDHGMSEAMFRRFVDPVQASVDWYTLKPEEKQGFLAKVAQGIGGLAQDLPVMIASGGASTEAQLAKAAPTLGEHLANVVSKGFDAMRPLMIRAGTEKAEQVLDAGGTPGEAVKSATTAALLTGFMGSAPMSASGTAAERLITGLPVGVATGEINRRVQNAADPENIQAPFTWEGAAVNAVTNAAMAGAMGHPEAPHPVSREALGYAPGTARADAAADIVSAAMGGRVEPVAKPTPADVMAAPTLDDAIAKAQAAVAGPVTDSTGRGLLERQMTEGMAGASNALMETARARQERADLADRLEAEDLAKKQAELEQLKTESIAEMGRLPDQQVAAAGAATDETPTAMALAMQRARAAMESRQQASVEPEQSRASAAPDVGAAAPPRLEVQPEPRIVDRQVNMLPMSRPAAERKAASTGGEVVRIQNRSGKFAYTVLREANVSNPDAAGRLAAEPGGPARAEPSGIRPVPESVPADAGGLRDSAEPARSGEADLAVRAGAEPTAAVGAGRAVALPELPSEAAMSAATSAKAESILDAAGIRGKDRLEALKDVRSGAITVDELARAHQPELQFSHADNSEEFVPAPTGGHSFGQVTPEMGLAMRRQAGEIRLQQGVQHKDGSGYGLAHIEARHGDQIRGIGFTDVAAFVHDALQHIDQIWKPSKTSQIIAMVSGVKGRAVYLELKPSKENGHDFYTVNSAFPVGEHYADRKGEKEGWKPLWSRDPVPADASGASGFAQQPPKAGEAAPMVHPSGDSIVGEAAKTGKPEGPAYSRSQASGTTVDAVKTAIKQYVGVTGFNRLGRIVATTAADIKSTWEPLIGKVSLESEGKAGQAQAFYDPKTKTVFLIADRIRPGDEQAVLGHELMHKWGQQVLGKEGWDKLHSTIGDWAKADQDSDEAAVYRFAASKVRAVGENLSTAELFPYAVEGAMKMGIQPSLVARQGTVARWLGQVRAVMRQVWEKIVSKPDTFNAQDLVDLAFGIAQHENPAHSMELPDHVNDAIQFSRADEATHDNETEPTHGAVSGLIHSGLETLSKGTDTALDKTGVYDAVAPMSGGTQRTRAIAQAHINAERKAQYQWTRLDEFLTKHFTEAQQEKMWNAADEQNELLKRGATPEEMQGKGIDSLTPEERGVMDTLHAASEKLYEQAKAVGLVKDDADGQKYWTPRMMAMVGEDGTFSKPGGEGQQATSDGKGRNITTTSKNLTQRKHDTAAESEAAMQALGGTLVRNIRTMPLAMAKLQRAIAGRELINQIRELGRATGEELVSQSDKPGFFTLDHPAFKSYAARLDAEGNVVHTEDGSPVVDSKPLYISNEFKGPLNAIMSQSNGRIYTGYMLLKSKAMSAIMYSPLIHNQVILGRALAYGGLKTPMLYWTGHAAKGDAEFMGKMIDAGMVPIGRHNNMLDVGDIARGLGKEGGWGDPNESWIGLGAKAAGNKIAPGLGTKAKAGIDWLGDVVHNKWLWDRVGDLQAGIGRDVYDKLIAKGLDENAATTVAAHIANRYAGAIGREAMSKWAHVAFNIELFSKSFNAGNIGTVKDAVYGLPAGLRAQLAEHSDVASAAKALQFAKNKARVGLVRDAAYAILLTSIVQDILNRDKDKSVAEQVSAGLDGYMKRAAEAWVNAKNNPLKLSSYNPYRLSSTWANEPDKRDRVDLGAQDNGRHEYMRLPTGKVVEDLAGWIFHPGDTLDKKESPLVRALTGLKNNAKDKYGTPVWDESQGTVQKMWDVAKFLAGTQMPLDQAQTLKDMAQGHGTELDKSKMLGNVTGLSVSQGHPGGPEAAVASGVEDRLTNSKRYTMENVKHDIKVGDEDSARQRLLDIGMTAREANNLIRSLENPKTSITPAQRKKFNKHATEDDRAEMESVSH